jgi:hypothetical protein
MNRKQLLHISPPSQTKTLLPDQSYHVCLNPGPLLKSGPLLTLDF